MNKKREYRKATVELCRNCCGRGYVYNDILYAAADPAGVSTMKCPICDGRGRVWKVNEGTVQIEPFAGQRE